MAKNPTAVSQQQLLDMILKLQEENKALQSKVAAAPKPKEISLDALGRMSVPLPGSVPFAFYLDQWDKFEPQIPAMIAFIKANRKKMPDEATRKAAAKERKASR